MSQTQLSVVIPTYNSAALVLRCLESLEAQTACKTSFEVLVVDDGSTDNSAQILHNYLYRTDLQLRLFLPSHGGPARARNYAVEQSQSEWIAFLDADMLASPQWVAEALLLIAQSTSQTAGFEGRTEIGQDDQVTPFTHQMLNVQGGRYPSCNLILRKELCQFYTGYEIAFREDTDLAFAILECGYQIPFEPKLLAFHPPLSPRYNRPWRLAMRYFYDGLLERRFPERYKEEVDVHVICGRRIPHLRRKIYEAFIVSSLLLGATSLLPWDNGLFLTLLSGGHLACYLIVLQIHLNHTRWSVLKWKDLAVLMPMVYFVPWILLVQLWRGRLAFKETPHFSKQDWPPMQRPASPKAGWGSPRQKIIPLRAHRTRKRNEPLYGQAK